MASTVFNCTGIILGFTAAACLQVGVPLFACMFIPVGGGLIGGAVILGTMATASLLLGLISNTKKMVISLKPMNYSNGCGGPVRICNLYLI